LSSSWPKIICDPIHRIISFENNECDRLLLQLIDTREFQRLRRIKQLGVAEQVFPGATHTRFAHSLGVMHTTRRLLRRIEEVRGKPVDEYNRTVVLCGALLHDLGHGPFSHAFESVTKENHEQRTREIILSAATEVNRQLTARDPALPSSIAAFFGGAADIAPAKTPRPPKSPIPWLKALVSSQLDADRFDYLLRDAWATGTELGRYDLEYLLANLKLDSERQRLYLSAKAESAAVSYVQARAHMYRAVYFHKTTRSAEVMLRLALKRYRELLQSAESPEAMAGIVPEARSVMVAAFGGTKLSLDAYLELDDVTVVDFLKVAASSQDPVLSGLAHGIVHRRLWKAVDLTDVTHHQVADFYEQARAICVEAGHSREYGLVNDGPKDTPYKDYDPDAEEPATLIYVGDKATTENELKRRSKHVASLAESYRLTRYHFPADVQPQMRALRAQISK
jgi:HD superfamily phosphohydrolase